LLENQIDRTRTKDARKAGILHDRRSFYTFAGHVFLRGEDRSAVRVKVFYDNITMRGGRCELCDKRMPTWDGEMDHIEGGRKNARCDCWRTVLNDGTTHSNLRRVCHDCHIKRHGRILLWKITPKKS
jgi:hypothetical protein